MFVEHHGLMENCEAGNGLCLADVGESACSDTCEQWSKGTRAAAPRRAEAAAQVRDEPDRILQRHLCAKHFARAFKLYERAAAFFGLCTEIVRAPPAP